jgi:hypothetical protein
MRRLLILSAACLALAGCNSIPSSANTAPRGSASFCEQYGRQTTANRVMDSGSNGHGPSGFDRTLARSAGERARDRCLGPRTDAPSLNPAS